MDKIIIYGLLNEDRRVFWVSDYWIGEYGDMDYSEDAYWKCLMNKDDEMIKNLEYIDIEKDVVIFEEMDRMDWSAEKVLKWVDIFKIENYIAYRPEEVIDFKMKQEREWEEEDKRRFDIK